MTGGDRGHAVDQCQASITQLSDEVRDASSYIPAHDRRIYGEGIKGLQQKFKDAQAAFAPRQKFSFKSGSSSFTARKNGNAGGTNDAQERKRQPDRLPNRPNESSSATTPAELILSASRPLDGNGVHIGSSPDELDRTRQISSPQNDTFSLRDRNGEHIIISPSASSGNLSTLDHCVVDMSIPTATGKPSVSLTLKNIKDSLIICGHVDGPAHLTSVSNSIIVVSSRQFRMHDSRSCHVYLLTTSRPIIENCSAIRFAPLPEIYRTEVDEQTEDHWQQVGDFNWHRSEPSPNWSILDVSQRVKPDVWRDAVPSQPGVGVEDILKAVHLPK